MSYIAGYIAGFPVAGMYDDVQLSRLEIQDISRPGIHGADWKQLGIRGEPFNLRTILDCVDPPAVRAAKIAYRNQVGRLVSITDPRGATWLNVMVLNVRFGQTQTGYFLRGGVNNGAHILTAIWELYPNATIYG